MALALSHLINVFATPTGVFLDLRERPRWIVAFAAISILSIGIAWFLAPVSLQLVQNMISVRLDEEQVQRTLAVAKRFQYNTLALTPVLVLGKWLILAGLIYFLSVLVGDAERVRFRTLYAVVAHTEMIFVLMAIVNVLLLHAKGPDSVQHVTDLQAIVGLEVILKERAGNLPLFTLLNSVNVFSIWYVATLSIGIAVITGFSKAKSAVLVTGVWLLGVGYQVAMAAISTRWFYTA